METSAKLTLHTANCKKETFYFCKKWIYESNTTHEDTRNPEKEVSGIIAQTIIVFQSETAFETNIVFA